MEIFERVAAGLLVVVPLIWIFVYFYSKQYGGAFKGVNGFMRIVANLPIGPKKTIAVVDIAGEYLVLGMTPERITYITRIEDPVIVEELKRGGENSGPIALKRFFPKGINLFGVRAKQGARDKR